MAVADLDHFKQINDTHGHAVGDAVLQQIGARMQSVLRVSDAIGRYGGEEFLLVLPRSDTAAAREVAERLRVVVEREPVRCGPVEPHVTVTVGVASTTEFGFNPTLLVHAADEALYRGKAAGGNRVDASYGQPRAADPTPKVTGAPG